jgi:hypothetical protein
MTSELPAEPKDAGNIDPNYYETLLSRFYTSGDPEHLAQLIEIGGPLTPGLRQSLAKLVRDHLPKLRNGSDPLRDVGVFDKVEAWRHSQMNAPIYKHIKNNDLTWLEAIRAFSEVPKNNLPSLQEAFRHFTDANNSVETETFQKQYERGRALSKGKI